jgi:hypothetical protein
MNITGKTLPEDIIEMFKKRHVVIGHRVFIYKHKRGRLSIECETCCHSDGRKSMREKEGRQHHEPVSEVTQ